MVRDAVKDRAFYDAAIAHHEAELASSLDELKRGEFPPNAGFYCLRVDGLSRLALARYSRGDDVAAVREIVEHLPAAVATWMALESEDRDEAIASGLAKPLVRAAFGGPVLIEKFLKSAPTQGSHRKALRWTSLAYLLGLPAAPAEQLVHALCRPGVERLLDHLCAAIVPGWKIAGKVGLPDLHGPLVDAIEGRHAEPARAKRLDGYLETWRSRMRGPEFGPHMLRDLNYYGTWCLEVAAVAVLTDTSDASFRDHPHYPRDLADEGRRRRRELR